MSWLENFFTLLKDNNGIITAIATGVLTVITWRYVRLTQKYVQLTQEMLRATNKPEVIAFLYYKSGAYSLCVENIGTGYASDVRFTGDLSFQLKSHKLGELEPFKNGIDYSGAGHKTRTSLSRHPEVTSLPKSSFKITITYKDSTNTEYTKTFSFNLRSWDRSCVITYSPADSIVDALRSIGNKG